MERRVKSTLTFNPSPQMNRSRTAAMIWSPASVYEKSTGLKETNRKQRTIKIDLGGKTLLFTVAIIFSLAQNLEVYTVKWRVPNGVGEVAA
jgi:hypothetical protein